VRLIVKAFDGCFFDGSVLPLDLPVRPRMFDFSEPVFDFDGSEFIAGIIREFLAENNIEAAYIEPGSPWQNGKGESFNGKFRDECLRMEMFGNWREAVVVSEKWRKYYNAERPHSSLYYQTPNECRLDWEKRQRLLKSETMKKLASPVAQGLGS